MKIFGIGVDIVKISRIEDMVTKSHWKRFITKVLHPKEIDHYLTLDIEQYGEFVASRWAAK